MVDGVSLANGRSARHLAMVEFSLEKGSVKIPLHYTAGQIVRVMTKKPKLAIQNPVLLGYLPGLKTSCGAVLEFQTVTLA